MTGVKQLDPLRDFLGAVVDRIEALESHCGISSASAPVSSGSNHANAQALQRTPSVKHISGSAETPSLKAYDKFLSQTVYKVADACDDLEGLEDTGKLLLDAFEGLRLVIVVSTRAKAPSEDLTLALTPLLKGTQDAIKAIRAQRLDRKFDNHIKAIMEMLTCVSWVYYKPPQSLPAAFVKECVGSSDFWSNKIRKEFKGKDDKQIAFCDALKNIMLDLAEYIQEHHKTGLTFNPKGVSIAEAQVVLSDDPITVAAATAAGKGKAGQRKSSVGNTVMGGNMLGLVSELTNRKSSDGSSAATGLKHVTKDQQTWRKEFKKDGGAPAKPKTVIKSAPKKPAKKKPTGLPILEYQERGMKWVVENQTKESALKDGENGVLVIDITDVKQQVYIYNCEEVTIKINGAKFKSLILDNCTKVNAIFDTIISGCELVNSKKVAVQVDGVCPAFTIDKTIGVTLWLSAETQKITSIAASMSSEMNVSIPDGDDRKEMPIPEQFVHKLTDGTLKSEVSDLYH